MSSDLALAKNDDYIVCDECGKPFMFGDCPEHGPLEWIDDCQTQANTQARASLPNDLYLMLSGARQGQLGVFTKARIEKRVMFGPFKGQKIPAKELTLGDNQNFMHMWDVFEDGKVLNLVDGSDEQRSNWMRFVNCARDDKEQNLVAVQFHGEIYFRTRVPVQAGTELLVWYSDSCIGTVDSSTQREQSGHDTVCEVCGQVFAGLICLLRHKSVRCPGLTRNSTSNTENQVESYTAIPANQPQSSPSTNFADQPQALDRGTSIDSDPTRSSGAEPESYVVVHIGSTYEDSAVIQTGKNSPYVVVHVQPAPTKTGTRRSKRPLPDAEKANSRKKTKVESAPQHSTDSARKGKKVLSKTRTSAVKVTKARSVAAKKPSHSKGTSGSEKRLAASTSRRSKTPKFRQRVVDKTKEKRNAKIIRTAKTESTSHPRKISIGGRKRAANKDETVDEQSAGKTTSRVKETSKTRKANSRISKSNSSSPEKTPREAKKHSGTTERSGQAMEPPKDTSTETKGKTNKPLREKPVFTCKICLGNFKWNSALQYHMRKHMAEKEFRCEICNKGLSQVSSLNRHMRIHRGERPHECQECGKKFLEKGKLVLHQRVHAGEPPEKKYKCTMCDRGFTLSANLRTHMRVHTGEKPYSCPQCGKAFKRSSDVASHLRSHTGERPYKCPQCPKAFTMISHRNRHQVIHTGEKPFKCDLCGKGFTQPSSVKAHLKVHAKREERLEDARGEKEKQQKNLAPKDASIQTDGKPGKVHETAQGVKGSCSEELTFDGAQSNGIAAVGILEEARTEALEIRRTQVIDSAVNVQLESDYASNATTFMIPHGDALGLLQLATNQVNQHEHLESAAHGVVTAQMTLRDGAELTTIASEQLELSCTSEQFDFVTAQLDAKELLPLACADQGNNDHDSLQSELDQNSGQQHASRQEERTLLPL